MSTPFNILWLQSGGCGGCTMSLLCAEGPDLLTTLDSAGIRMLWHPGLSEETGSEALAVFERVRSGAVRLDALCVEGSLLRGPNGTGRFHVLAGTGRPTIEWVRELAALAEHVIAVGTCAAYGGVTAAGINPADACGLQYDGRREGGALGAMFRSRSGLPVINVAGCPTHPNWVTETLMLLASGLLGAQDLDAYRRPRFYADHLVHHGCPRNEYYEFKASAEKLSDLGCMMEHLGCLGTQAHADCNTRSWNGEGSCTRGGYACINCTAPEFEEPGHAFLETPKVAGIPVGLPTDMPKAWFIALSSLAKAATPERLRRNAVSDHLVVPPTVRDIKRR
ncbi:NADH-quinone oxidoreductase subunit B family protein [Roseixanthobacter liquoris]|uniref:NADH-quinone oxidoreductase subunit B family protein n=1 Tax=Roseixanthobacter liquoris TaxID=3119921 RepID=UPI0037277305